jgi:hypothetical protein
MKPQVVAARTITQCGASDGYAYYFGGGLVPHITIAQIPFGRSEGYVDVSTAYRRHARARIIRL